MLNQRYDCPADVRQRKTPLYRQVVFSRRQYRTLPAIAEAIAVHRDLDELFRDLADRFPRVVPLDFINLVLHDPTRDILRLQLLVAPAKPRQLT